MHMQSSIGIRFALVAGLLVLSCAQGCAKSDPSGTKKDMLSLGDQGGAGDLGIQDLAGGGGPDLSVAGPDAAAPGPCNVVTQTGCADGQKCSYSDPTAGTVMSLCETDGQELAGQPCNDGTNGDCIGANLCTIEDEAKNVNQCRSWCNQDNDCSGLGPIGPDNRAFCELPIMGFPSKLCSQPCNPVPTAGATGCVTELGCRYFSVTRGAAKLEATNCGKVGIKVSGDDCANTDECGGALVCVSVNMGTAKCRSVCRNQANGLDMKPNDCALNESCNGLAGLVDPFFGICLPN